MIGYERGSEWRRWDLHIHTPGTQKNDHYSGSTPENKWNQFYQTINDYIGDGSDSLKSIAVIGITDYLSVDNFCKVIQDRRMPASVKMVVPNVEMRMVPLARQTPVNIHCIFDPMIVSELESRFFSKLHYSYDGTAYSASHDDLRRLGRAFSGQNLSADNAYSAGLEQFVITPEALENVFKGDSELRDHTIIAVSNRSADGASGITQHQGYTTENGSQMDATRQSIYRMADLIFSSSLSDISYFLGEKGDDARKIIEKYGSRKGCIHGSDAHSNEKIFEPEQKRYCWIKSDPTFNGLKQIIYEPKSRIRISHIMPEEKPAYQIIDSVIFSNPDFQQEPILFNDKLTCIIGGKSTGKSLLLHNMASAVDKAQVSKKLDITKSKNRTVPETQVKWADGSISKPGAVDEKHKIVYVPQTYLNRLTDENEEKTEIDSIIQEIIMINPDAVVAYEAMKTALGNYKQDIDKRIYDCVQRYNGFIDKKKALSDIGSREGIQAEIEHLKKKKDELTRDASITQEEVATYDTASAAITRTNAELAEIERDLTGLNIMVEVFQQIELSSDFSNAVLNRITESICKIQNKANSAWNEEKQNIIGEMEQKKAKLESEKQKYKEIANQIAPKIAGNEAVKKITEQIATEEEKLVKYNEIEKQKVTQKQMYEKAVEAIVEAYDEFKTIRDHYAETIKLNQEKSNDDLVFSVTTPFRTEALCGALSGIFDKRSIRAQRAWLDLDEFDANEFTMKENLKKLISLTLSEELRITKGKTMESALRDIFSDWYNSNYQVVMDGDAIGSMSPGKKALVLLKLLINLDESKCPILIDQPEDDLDNRSIFDELIPFIRRKKIDRQIIIVTHNANVVLGGDADEVIIANQNGNNAPNKNYRFEYRSGSIEDDMPLEENAADVLSRQGIQQHICDILEGGEKAFDLRRNKYRI